MPLFELDESGSRLVQPMQPAAASFGPESAQLVTEHLSELLGEGLFPVATRRSAQDQQPHMLALDVVGQPVVIEVVAELDADALIQALAYAGQAGRFTSNDLAELYDGGAEQFRVDIMAFRDSLPAAYSRRGLRVGARLLLVCSSVSPEIADALDFLRAPGRQVEVLQMGVVHGAGGRRYLDVSPLAGPIAEMRQVEQANLRLVRSKEAFAAAMAYDEQRRSFARFAADPERAGESAQSPFAATGTDGPPSREISIVSPVTGSSPVASPAAPAVRAPHGREGGPAPHVPTGGQAPPAPAAPPRASAFAPPEARAVPPPPTANPASPVSSTPPAPNHAPSAPVAPRGAPAQADQAATPGRPPVGEPYIPRFVPASSPLIPPDARPLTEEPAPPAAHPGVPANAASSLAAPPPTAPTRPAAPPAPSRPPAPVRTSARGIPIGPPMALSTGSHPLGTHATTGHGQSQGVGPAKNARPEPALLEIASAEGPLELVWLRERRGQRLTATLRADGLIELPSGEVFGNPDAAAQVASHAALKVDGWGVWRIGDGGPTLRQATSSG